VDRVEARHLVPVDDRRRVVAGQGRREAAFRQVQAHPALASVRRGEKFEVQWVPVLLNAFCENRGGTYRLLAGKVALEPGGLWGYCERRRYTQRPFPGPTGA
jgi:hypothetical protein